MVLIDASSRWSHVCLLSSRNQAFAKLLVQIIRLRVPSRYPIKAICLDNAGEFTSQAFDAYYLLVSIKFEHPIAHVHTKNVLLSHLLSAYN